MAKDLTKKQTGDVKESIDRIYFIMAGIVVVMVVGFITLLITVLGLVIASNDERATKFQELNDKVNILIQQKESNE